MAQIPGASLKITTNVLEQTPVAAGVVGVTIATERGKAYTPTLIETVEDFTKKFGGKMASNKGIQYALMALELGAKLMVNRVLRLASQNDKTSSLWTSAAFTINPTTGGAATNAAGAAFAWSLPAIPPAGQAANGDPAQMFAQNKQVTVYLNLSGLDIAGNQGLYNLGTATISQSAATTTEVIDAVDAAISLALLPGGTWTKSKTSTSLTITSPAAVGGVIANTPQAQPFIQVVTTGGYNIVASPTGASAANLPIGMVIKPKSPDAAAVPYYWAVTPAASGLANTYDIIVGDERYPSLEQRISDVPKAYTAQDLVRVNDNNDYLDFTYDYSVANVNLRVVPRRLLSSTAGSLGAYTAPVFTPAVIDADYIGSAIGGTGIHAFNVTTEPDLYVVLDRYSTAVDLAVSNYTKSLDSVSGEYGFTAQHVLQAGSPTNSIAGTLAYLSGTGITDAPQTIALGPGVNTVQNGFNVVESMLPWFIAGWSRQATGAPNYSPAGEYAGAITSLNDVVVTGVAVDITSPANTTIANTAYTQGLNMPKQDATLGTCIWGIRTLAGATNAIFKQIPSVRSLMYIKRNIRKVDTAGLFGPNVDGGIGSQKRRRAITTVLDRAVGLGAIQPGYTFKSGSEVSSVITNVNEWPYEFSVIPVFSTERVTGTGVATTETNTISFA